MKPTRYHIPLFCLVTSLYWFSLYAYVPTLPNYAEALGADHRMVGLILGSYGFTQMLLRIPLGIYSDVINRRKIFVILGIACSLIGALGMLLFPSPILMLLFRSITGAAAATWVTYTVLFSSYFKREDTTKAIGYISSFNAAGQMVAMVLGGGAAERLDMSAPFAVAAVGGAIGLLLSFAVVDKGRGEDKQADVSNLAEVGRNKQVLTVSGLAILVQIMTFSTVYGFTPIAAENIGAGAFELGLLTMLSTLPRIAASALSGAYFVKQFGERKTLIGGFIVLGTACMVIPAIGELIYLYISQIIGGFARGVVFPVLMGMSIKNIAEHKRAAAMGFFQAIYGLGMFIGPVFVGIISDAMSLAWGFILIAITGFLGAAYVWRTSESANLFQTES